MSFKEISPEQAWEWCKMVLCLQTFGIHNVLPTPMQKGRFILTNQSFLQFEEQVDFDSPIIVSCYHGVSSRNVATFLVEQGYRKCV